MLPATGGRFCGVVVEVVFGPLVVLPFDPELEVSLPSAPPGDLARPVSLGRLPGVGTLPAEGGVTSDEPIGELDP